MKIGAIIQARMGSTRLPGKVMEKIEDETVLHHVIDRVNQSRLINEVIIATTNNESDEVIVAEALVNGATTFRGSEYDVLSRYYLTAKENNLDVVVRITSDCPLIDPHVIDSIIKTYLEGDYELVTNGGAEAAHRTFPRGLDTEVFSFDILEKAFNDAKEAYQREHVTPYIYGNSKKIFYYKNDIDYSHYRLTLDTQEDLTLIRSVYAYLFQGVNNFYLREIIKLFEQRPEIPQINAHIEQKKIKED